MTNDRISAIRRAEAYSHTDAYTNFRLFETGSWLSKPVKTVMEQVSVFSVCAKFRGLDLGCGVGRNCIPIMQDLKTSDAKMDCVDILPLAIEKLLQNAQKYGVLDVINPVVCSVDRYQIPENTYDLILAVSVMEHLDSVDTLHQKLLQIRKGLQNNGIACFIINTSIAEHAVPTGESVPVQFEINLTAAEMESYLRTVFSEDEEVKFSVIHQQYETSRESGTVRLDTDVLTYVVRKRS